ncbi:MAG: DsbA family protein [Polymorphobacter sp.]
MPDKLKTIMETRVRAIWAIGAVLAAGIGGAVLAAGSATSVATGDRAAIEKIVREYILAHPEIIPEAMTRLQNREVTQLLESNRKEIETPFAGAVAGNPKGDVSVVVFFDYACPYCRQGHADVARLAAEDKNLRIVYRDFPVLSPASDEAAMASLSAAQQGRYVRFHDAMFETPGKVAHERTVAVVRAAGLNEMQTAKDLNAPALKAEIKKNLDLGRALGLTGTPSYVVGNRILSGAVGYEKLKEAVAAAREVKAG